MWCQSKGAVSRVCEGFAVERREILFISAAACKQGNFRPHLGCPSWKADVLKSVSWTCCCLAHREQGKQSVERGLTSLPFPQFHRKDIKVLVADSLCLFSGSHLDGSTSPPVSSQPFHTINYCQSVVHLPWKLSDL